MLASLFFALAAAGAGGCTVPAEELERQAALPYPAFDLDPGAHAWRRLGSTGCVDGAVLALQAYAAANEGRLAAAEKSELAFHAGQTLALAGRESESVVHFERALAIDAAPAWSAYVEATLAFLRRDAAALRTARDRYALIAPGSMRLRFIDGMLACPAEPYAKAVHCRR